MWPFSHGEPQAAQPPSLEGMAALGEAFARSFAAQIEGNAKIAQVFSSFISQMGDLSIRQAARAMGQRSAATRSRDRKGKFNGKKKTGECPLCIDPNTRTVTIEMIKAHRGHETGFESPDSGTSPGAPPDFPEVPTELGN